DPAPEAGPVVEAEGAVDAHPGLGVGAERAPRRLAERPPVVARGADRQVQRLLESLALAAHLLGRATGLEREVDPDLRARVGERAQLARDLRMAHVVGDVVAARARVEEAGGGGEEGRAAAPACEEPAPLVPAVVRVGPARRGDTAREA